MTAHHYLSLEFGDCQLLVRNNKYLRLYERLIFIAKNRKSPEQYTEQHHIIPRCVGGTDHKENLIILTYREHFIAHWILTEICPDRKLKYAIRRMCNGKKKITPWQFSLMKSFDYKHSENTKNKMRVSAKNKSPVSKETRKKLSIAAKDRKRKPFTEEHKQKMSESAKNRFPMSKNTRQKMSKNKKGLKNPKAKKVKINDIIFSTYTEASKIF